MTAVQDQRLVSIVLPTYNGSRHLVESIEGVLAQTYQAWELIIVDDCSKDSTPQIIDRYRASDPRIRSVRNDPNRRLPASLNRGFRETRGEYLTWTSDDNRHRPDALETMAAFLDANAEVDVVYTDVTDIDDDGKVLMPQSVGAAELLAERNVVGSSFMYRRRVMEGVGDYAEDAFLAEDYDFWIRAALKFTLRPLHRDLYLYRRHASSLTSTQTERVHSLMRVVRERHLPQMLELRPLMGSRAALIASRNAMDAGDMRAARRHFFAGARKSPVRCWAMMPGARLPLAVLCGRPFADTLAKLAGRPGKP